jgi:hypothetical protein
MLEATEVGDHWTALRKSPRGLALRLVLDPPGADAVRNDRAGQLVERPAVAALSQHLLGRREESVRAAGLSTLQPSLELDVRHQPLSA